MLVHDGVEQLRPAEVDRRDERGEHVGRQHGPSEQTAAQGDDAAGGSGDGHPPERQPHREAEVVGDGGARQPEAGQHDDHHAWRGEEREGAARSRGGHQRGVSARSRALRPRSHGGRAAWKTWPVVESLAPSIEVTRVPPLLATKLQAPAVRRELVGRGGLVNRLREGAAGRMTVVTAPPGWGKTTLLAAWRLVEGGHPPFAWVSLDAGDNDPAHFWSYVVEALRAADPALEASLGPVRAVGSAAAADVVLPRVVNALAEHDNRVVLVLDDYHSIVTPELHTALAALIERAPAALHVALASRAEPPLPLGRLRARGELSEVGTDALRFSGREAAVLLNGVLDLGLTGRDVE